MSPLTGFLRPEVVIEPLSNRWPALPHCLSPLTSAMWLANHQMKILRSFVRAPATHVAAQQNPAMKGGPFLAYDPSAVDAVRALADAIETDQAEMLALAEAIKAVENLIVTEAKGNSMRDLYPRVPEALRGYVELTYDINNQPAVRYLESLLYRSSRPWERAQGLAMYVHERETRPNVYSNPRLPADDQLYVALPFRSSLVDELHRARYREVEIDALGGELGLGGEQKELFRSFFTREAPSHPSPYSGSAPRVRYFGHACVLIETGDVTILLDPFVALTQHGGDPHYTFADLPAQIDYVLITHGHHDHVVLETLLHLRHRIGRVIVPKARGGLADPSLRLMFQSLGFDALEVESLDTIAVPGGEIQALPFFGEHGDLDVAKTTYRVSLAGFTMLFLADLEMPEPEVVRIVGDALGPVDMIFIGLHCEGGLFTWSYGPLLVRPLPRSMDQSRSVGGSGFERGKEIVSRLRPRAAYVYAMGIEPWTAHINSFEMAEGSRPITEARKFVEHCMAHGVASELLNASKELLLGRATLTLAVD